VVAPDELPEFAPDGADPLTDVEPVEGVELMVDPAPIEAPLSPSDPDAPSVPELSPLAPPLEAPEVAPLDEDAPDSPPASTVTLWAEIEIFAQ
jgi:hypothetical protein